jgi:ferredoxin-NADP reductase
MAVESAFRNMRVIGMEWEAEGVVSIRLAAEDGSDLPVVECGAHIDLMLRPDLIRQYSLCGEPDVRNHWTIAVLREEKGRGGSAFVHDELRVGAVVPVAGPRNNFKLVSAESYLFIAGGIGITPLLPMIKHVAGQGKPYKLLYGGRRRASMAFLRQLESCRPHVTIAPQDEVGLLDLDQAIADSHSDSAVYCCGPEVLIQAVEQACQTHGRSEPFVERFGARIRSDTKGFAGNSSFEIELSETGRRFLVPADKSIIEVLAEAGVYAPTSCTEGYCGACETQVLEGIPDHRDDYYTDEERAKNDRMMICVGRSKTPLLVLKQ